MDIETINRIRSHHPLQYGYRIGDTKAVYDPCEDATVTKRYNRCPKCEQWSPCDVRELLQLQEKREQQVQTVRGAITGALAGGHIDGQDGAGYSKNVLRQIADLLDIELPEIVK
jgi:hypothetical protein